MCLTATPFILEDLVGYVNLLSPNNELLWRLKIYITIATSQGIYNILLDNMRAIEFWKSKNDLNLCWSYLSIFKHMKQG